METKTAKSRLRVTFPNNAMSTTKRLGFELKLRELCRKAGWAWTGEGVDLTTGERDICFEKK